MTPADLFKANRPKAVDAARAAALAHYPTMFEWFAETQQRYADQPSIAKETGHVAYLYQRAYVAEMDDPEPRANLRQSFCCIPCHVFYIAAAQNSR